MNPVDCGAAATYLALRFLAQPRPRHQRRHDLPAAHAAAEGAARDDVLGGVGVGAAMPLLPPHGRRCRARQLGDRPSRSLARAATRPATARTMQAAKPDWKPSVSTAPLPGMRSSPTSSLNDRLGRGSLVRTVASGRSLRHGASGSAEALPLMRLRAAGRRWRTGARRLRDRAGRARRRAACYHSGRRPRRRRAEPQARGFGPARIAPALTARG
jgi:hypothetical protein